MDKGAVTFRANAKNRLKIDFEKRKEEISHQLAMEIVIGSGLKATDQIGEAFQAAAIKDATEKTSDLQARAGYIAND